MKKKNFFRLLFFSFLIIILVYTVGVTGVYFFKNDQLKDQERRNNHKMMLVQVQKAMDKRIQAALSGIIQLQSSEDFIQYSLNKNERLNYYYMNEVFKELRKDSTVYANYQFNIGVMKTNSDIVITPNYTINREDYYKELGLNRQNLKELQSFIDDNTWISMIETYPLVTKTKDQNLTFVKKSRVGNGNMLIFVTFHHNDLLLEQRNNLIGDGIAILADNQILMKDTSFNEKTSKTIFASDAVNLISAKNELDPSHITYDVSNFTVHSIGSEIMRDWRYLYIVPSKIEHPISGMELIQSISILLGLLVIGVLLTFLIANYIYRPVKNIVGILREGQDLDTDDEFSFIHHKTVKIKSINEQLQETIEESKLSLKVKFLRELLLGIAHKESISENIEQLNLDVLQTEITLILLSIRKNGDVKEKLSQDGINKLKSHAINFLKEFITNHNLICEVIELDSEKIAIFVKVKDVNQVKDVIEEMMNQVEDEIRSNIVMAVANPVTSVHQIEQAYNQARNLLEYQYVFDKNTILTMKVLEDIEHDGYFYPMDAEVDLIQLTLGGKKEKAVSILKNIVQENLQKRNLNKQLLSQFVLAIVGTVNRILHHVNKAEKDLFKNEIDLYNELLEFSDKEELENRIYDIFNLVFKEFEKEETEDKSIGNQLVDYIQQNYTSDISLNDLSDKFQLSTSYISTIFKAYTGTNFKEFLNRYRIQKAKEILSSNDIMVNQVALMVGYNNVNTFIRLFKKYVGLSPGQYEKNINEKCTDL